jgi:flagellar motility protein MotE (MotC chaperone)
MTKQQQPAKKQASSVRLIPAVMVTVAAVLGLKAVAMAEGVAETVAEAGHDQPAASGEGHGEQAAAPLANTAQCTAPSLADMAGLSQAEVQVLQALGTRRAELDARGEAMETQDGLMLAAEQRLSERLAELRALETHVNDLLGQLDEAQEARLRSLVDVYTRMRAKDAAAVFDGLEDDVLVQVASRMREANLAEVMGRMDPNRARALTRMLADRARPPTNGGALVDRARGDAPAAAP